MRPQQSASSPQQQQTSCITWFISRSSFSHLRVHRQNLKVAPAGHHPPISKSASLQSIPEAAELIVAGREVLRQTSCSLAACSSAQAGRLTRVSPGQRQRRRRAVFQSALAHARGEHGTAERMRLYASLCCKYTRAAVHRLRVPAITSGLPHTSSYSLHSVGQRGAQPTAVSCVSRLEQNLLPGFWVLGSVH